MQRRVLVWSGVLVGLGLALPGCRPGERERPSRDALQTRRFGEHGQFLREAERIELYSLASTGPSIPPDAPATSESFHGFQVYGSVAIAERSDLQAAWADLQERIYAGPGTRYTYCFWPRHGIRAYRAGVERDYVVCFQCEHLYIYRDPRSEDHERIGLESHGSTLRLNEILDRAGVPRERPRDCGEEAGGP